MASQKKYQPIFSFEFFPPKTEDGKTALKNTLIQLAQLKPRFFSVTFGAGGSTREGTQEMIKMILAQGQKGAPHISCMGSARESIAKLLHAYVELGVNHIVALRGDRPKDGPAQGDFTYPNELVEFIRAETGDHFHIEIAAYPEFHPESPTPESDLNYFKRKVDAGANSAITQYFFNPDAYYRYIDAIEALGLTLPVVPGIMPITNYKQLTRFSDACGAEIPRWIRKRLEAYDNDIESIRAFGLDVVTDLCQRLLSAGAPGLHFYTLNRAGTCCTIWERLGL